jgi:hypothetical protein
MRAQSTERSVSVLMGQISCGEIRLPELQRGYVWKPMQVARLVDSLYYGFPTGSLMFWNTAEPPRTRRFSTGSSQTDPVVQPLYLLDGQQRLTALHRVLNDHEDAQVVFNVKTEAFQNQSAATAKDPRWVKVYDLVRPGATIFNLVYELHEAIPQVDQDLIAERLHCLAAICDYKYHMQVLSDIPYEKVVQIFVRVNCGGRALRTSDHALATLSARWPGVLGKLETEAQYWASQDYGNLDVPFLTRALTSAVLGGGLSDGLHARLTAIGDEELGRGWQTVQRGLRHLVPMLKKNLKVTHSSLLPSLLVLLPLVVLLGERPDERLDNETADGIVYWLLIATIRNRYGGATDTRLGQDIPTARQRSPEWGLLTKLGVVGTRVDVTTRELTGRSVNSPYHLLSFLISQDNGARDWWHGTEVALGGSSGQQLESHHIHPQATLTDHTNHYAKAEINDLANLAFISGKANKKISDRSPEVYFPSLGDDELRAHFVPLDEALRDASAYREFLAARRRLLAAAMTSLLDKFRPSWLDNAARVAPLPPAGSTLNFTMYESEWDAARIVVTARHRGVEWAAVIVVADLLSALSTAADELDDDIEVQIGGQSVLVQVDGDDAQIPLGPFLVTGSGETWRKTLDRKRADAQPLSRCPTVATKPWRGEPIPFPVTSVD